MSKSKRKLLVTAALPYANGNIHLGHLLGYIQADIWVRFQRMRGHDCLFISGSDAHGTPIMLKAHELDCDPAEMVAKVRDDHEQDFRDFGIIFDNFYTTHSAENQQLAKHIYTRLQDNGDIIRKTIQQAYDPEKQMFLPDRFIKGQCPRCHSEDQYGDSCDACGSTYTPAELINPISVLSGATPVEKYSEHYFFALERYQQPLKKWIQEGHLQPQISRKLDEWFADGLREWDISRDEPYFGFEIPDAPGKYFYVWLDAPIGYMASLENFCQDHKHYHFHDYWAKDSQAEIYHFIGKDIVYFHSLFWPAMLMGAGFRTPTAIYANGFVTVNGKKMSKSKGTFINAATIKTHLDPEVVRYYFAAKSNSTIEDTNVDFDDLMQRVNADLVGKVVNIASRCAGFIRKKFDNTLASNLANLQLYQQFAEQAAPIAARYEAREYAQAVRMIIELADKANQYIAEQAPWTLAKQAAKQPQVHEICSLAINLFRVIILYLKPIIPTLAEKSEAFLNINPLIWDDAKHPLLNHQINAFKPLMQRIELDNIQAIIDK